MTALTEEQLKSALPAEMKKNVNPLLLMKINNLLDSPEEWEGFRENLIGYSNVLSQGKFKLDDYVNAVRYVSYKVMGYSNKDSYMRTFPDRQARFIQEGKSDKDISAYVSIYNKGKLVTMIYEQTLIPTHILNADRFQQAINVQADLMFNAKSEMVRFNAANSLMTHLKAPEVKKMELDVSVNQNTAIDDYKIIMQQMAEKQLEFMEKGGDVKAITNFPIKPQDKEEAIDI